MTENLLPSHSVKKIELKGTAIGNSQALGQLFFLARDRGVAAKEGLPKAANLINGAANIENWHRVRAEARAFFERKKQQLELKSLHEEAQLFDTYMMMLDDPDFEETLLGCISAANSSPAEASADSSVEDAGLAGAIKTAAKVFADQMRKLDNAYLRERAKDIEDFGNEVAQLVLGRHFGQELQKLDKPVILLAKDLSASEVIDLAHTQVAGVVLEHGSPTSHVAIFLKALNIPALFQVKNLFKYAHTPSLAFLDAKNERLSLHLNSEEIAKVQTQIEENNKRLMHYRSLRKTPVRTKSGEPVLLMANAGCLDDVKQAVEVHAGGIGLFRTEFLFIERDSIPSEDEQFEIYKQILETAKGAPVTMRTMDIGGDKEFKHLGIAKETNPFLGIRGIRLSLKREDLFLPQLRALMRASAFGPLNIMVPMVATLSEWLSAKNLMSKAWHEVNIKKDLPSPKLGLMLEVPSLVFSIAEVSQHADFISVGSNDLTQYLYAADRTHTDLCDYAQMAPESLWRALDYVTKHKNKDCEISICGELASQPKAALQLAELGIRKLSMTPSQIDEVRGAFLDQSLPHL